MDWSISKDHKPTDKQPNREYRRLQVAHERMEMRFWIRFGAILVIFWSLAAIYFRYIFA